MSMARCIGWCRASPSELLARIDRLGGLNAPHLILGKIFAQAYDTAAYKIAADDLLAAHKVDILFHALGAGVVMQDDKRIDALMVETKAGRQAVRAPYLHRLLRRRRSRGLGRRAFEIGDNDGSMLYPSMMFRLNGVDPRQGGRSLANDSGADGRGRSAAARIVSRARARSCGRRSPASNGG